MQSSLALLSHFGNREPFIPSEIATIQCQFGKKDDSSSSETGAIPKPFTLQQVAKAALDCMAEPAGFFVAKQLLSLASANLRYVGSDKIHALMLQEASNLLEDHHQDIATELLSAIDKKQDAKGCVNLLADLLRVKVFQQLQGEGSNPASVRRHVTLCETSCIELEQDGELACKRTRLYSSLLDQDPHFSQPANSSDAARTRRHHYLLRMAKSNSNIKEEEFYGLLPGEGIAMVLEDLDTYLATNPQSTRALLAKKTLLHSRALTLEAYCAENLSRKENNPLYVEIYFDDIKQEVDRLSQDEHLLLFGGSFDHAMLHELQQGASLLKTFNSGLEVRQQHIPRANNRFQTHMISNLTKAHITRDDLKGLLGAKLKRIKGKNDTEKINLSQKQVKESYKILRKLANKTPARIISSPDSIHAHKWQIHQTCMRTIYQHWLKELLTEECPAYKFAFSEKAQAETTGCDLYPLGEETLIRRRKKAKLIQ